jgi:predicted O-methyltransferase YrrM
MSREGISKSYQYIASLYCDEDDNQKRIVQAVSKAGNLSMQSTAVEGKLIYTLLKSIKASRVIEIGTLGGYSASWIARALPEEGRLYSIDRSASNIAMAKQCLNSDFYQSRIKFLLGNAIDVLNDLKEEAPFDAIFIDADKISYPKYLQHAKSLLRSGGMVIADNTFLFELVFSDQAPKQNPQMWEGMREFNERMATDPAFDSIIIPTEEGLTVAIKK